MTDIECILAVPRVKGFDLHAKEWCELNIGDIRDAGWDETPFKNLVLPPGEKDLVFAFANQARHSKEKFDDFVQQKGQGIIILLCGPPGVGKTLTAEAAAEMSRAPLYVLSASDLGTNPAHVDSALTEALERCRLWDALLLLDEADVFLEMRSSNSLDRNELVSIFLRRLEYYRGLMFLTTNRINTIDTAFKGRIDLILPYYDLDEDSRKSVWKNFINRLSSGAADVRQDDVDILAKDEMNGREIKNSIKTAMVLAERKKEPLNLGHLRVVLDIRKRVATFELLDEKRKMAKRQQLYVDPIAGE